MGLGANPARDVHAAADHVVPQGLAYLQQLGIACFLGEIRHRAEQVHGPHRMPLHRGLFPHLQVGLVIIQAEQAPIGGALRAPGPGFLFEVVGLFPPLLHEELGEPQVPLIPGHPVEPDQGQLDLFMARVTLFLSLFRAEDGIDVLNQLADHLQELVLPRGFVIGHGRFDKMAGAVQLMVFRQIGPAVFWIHDGVIRVEVAIGLLGPGHQIDHFIRGGLQLGIGMGRQTVGHCLQPFGHIAILKDHALELTSLFTRGDAQIFYGMTRLPIGEQVIEGLPLVRDHLLPDHRGPISQESSLELRLLTRN